jgi:hypothetical protein
MTAPTPAGPVEPTIVGVRVSGPESMRPGEVAQFTAVVNYSNGTSTDITEFAAWTTSDRLVLTLESGGRVTAIGRGESTVIASHATSSGASPSVLVLDNGTFRVSGRVAWGPEPVRGVLVEVISGTGAGQRTHTDNGGRYALYGLAGPVRLRVMSDGMEMSVRDAVVTDHAVVNFDIPGGLP